MGSIRTFFYYKMHVIWGPKGRVCYKKTLTKIIRELAIIVLKSFFSCSGLAKASLKCCMYVNTLFLKFQYPALLLLKGE